MRKYFESLANHSHIESYFQDFCGKKNKLICWTSLLLLAWGLFDYIIGNNISSWIIYTQVINSKPQIFTLLDCCSFFFICEKNSQNWGSNTLCMSITLTCLFWQIYNKNFSNSPKLANRTNWTHFAAIFAVLIVRWVWLKKVCIFIDFPKYFFLLIYI